MPDDRDDRIARLTARVAKLEVEVESLEEALEDAEEANVLDDFHLRPVLAALVAAVGELPWEELPSRFMADDLAKRALRRALDDAWGWLGTQRGMRRP